MGAPPGAALVTQTSFAYTSTKSIFTMSVAGKVEMNVTFLSPLTPTDLTRQSLLFSYLDVAVQSSDGSAHEVQLYADISAEWVAGDHGSTAQWDYATTGDGISYHKVYRQTQLLYSETNEQADWGYWYWSTKETPNLTYQSGEDIVVRSAFQSSGTLPNTSDNNFRAINNDWPVFAYSINLYGDRELKLGLVPQAVYDMQSTFYPTVEEKYGVPLDTRHNYTKSDWEMFTAAIASTSTQQMFMSDLAKWINETPTNVALTDLYDAQTGNWPIDAGDFASRPVVGGHFALLALGS